VWLPLVSFGAVAVIAVIFDVRALISIPGFWTILLILLFIAMGGMGILFLRMAKAPKPPSPPDPPDPPNPPQGCLPHWIWIIGWVISMVYLAAGIVWLLGDADSGGGGWTLGPIAVVLIVAGIGFWLWAGMIRTERSTKAVVGRRKLGLFLGVLILVVGIVGIVLWFAGGRADDGGSEAVSDGGAAVTDSIAVPATEVEEAPVETSTVEDTDPPDEVDPSPEEVEETTTSAAVPEGTPLPDDVGVLLNRWCAAALTPPSGPPTVESVFGDSLDVVTRPADSTDPPVAADPPEALEIMNLGGTSAGCNATPKFMVIAYLAGPPSDIQIAVALDLAEDPGNVADPDSSELIPQIGGWDEFISYGAASGLFHSDSDFVPIDTPVDVDMEGNAFAFIIDQPADAEMIELTLQTFFRAGDLASSPTAWQGATIRVDI